MRFCSSFGARDIVVVCVVDGCGCGGRGSRQDMAAMAASPSGVVTQADHNTTLMEDPDVWRPT